MPRDASPIQRLDTAARGNLSSFREANSAAYQAVPATIDSLVFRVILMTWIVSRSTYAACGASCSAAAERGNRRRI